MTLEAQNNTFYVIQLNDNMFITNEEKDAILKYKELTKTVANDIFPSIVTFTRNPKKEKDAWSLKPMPPQYIVKQIIALDD